MPRLAGGQQPRPLLEVGARLCDRLQHYEPVESRLGSGLSGDRHPVPEDHGERHSHIAGRQQDRPRAVSVSADIDVS